MNTCGRSRKLGSIYNSIQQELAVQCSMSPESESEQETWINAISAKKAELLSTCQEMKIVGRQETMKLLTAACERDNLSHFGLCKPSVLRDGVVKLWMEFPSARPESPFWVSIVAQWLAQQDNDICKSLPLLLLLKNALVEAQNLDHSQQSGCRHVQLLQLQVVIAFLGALSLYEAAASPSIAFMLTIVFSSAEEMERAIGTMFTVTRMPASKVVSLWCAFLCWLPLRRQCETSSGPSAWSRLPSLDEQMRELCLAEGPAGEDDADQLEVFACAFFTAAVSSPDLVLATCSELSAIESAHVSPGAFAETLLRCAATPATVPVTADSSLHLLVLLVQQTLQSSNAEVVSSLGTLPVFAANIPSLWDEVHFSSAEASRILTRLRNILASRAWEKQAQLLKDKTRNQPLAAPLTASTCVPDNDNGAACTSENISPPIRELQTDGKSADTSAAEPQPTKAVANVEPASRIEQLRERLLHAEGQVKKWGALATELRKHIEAFSASESVVRDPLPQLDSLGCEEAESLWVAHVGDLEDASEGSESAFLLPTRSKVCAGLASQAASTNPRCPTAPESSSPVTFRSMVASPPRVKFESASTQRQAPASSPPRWLWSEDEKKAFYDVEEARYNAEMESKLKWREYDLQQKVAASEQRRLEEAAALQAAQDAAARAAAEAAAQAAEEKQKSLAALAKRNTLGIQPSYSAEELRNFKLFKLSAVPKVGLRNLGNTCYFNSVVQALYMTNAFVANMMVFKPKLPKKGAKKTVFDEAINPDLCDALRTLFYQMSITKRPHIYPDFVVEKMPEMYQGNQQQDASEALRTILDAFGGLRQALVFLIFSGMLCNKVKCMKCGNISRRNETINDLSFTVPGEKFIEEHNAKLKKGQPKFGVQDLVDKQNRKETLKGDNAYFCEKCAKKQTAEKWVDMVTPPAHLMVVLNCFGWDMGTGDRKKLKSEVQPHTHISIGGEEGRTYNYTLYAAVIHEGATANSGHYFMIGRRAEGDVDGWSRLDDSKITSLDADDDTAGEREICRLFSKNEARPYILFYRCDEAPPSAPTGIHADEARAIAAYEKERAAEDD